MTTFEDLDLVEAFGDFGEAEPAPRRRSAVVAVVAFAVALALIVVGIVWASNAGSDGAAQAAETTSVVPQLAVAQSAADKLDDGDLAELAVLADSTRLLTTTALGTHYAAIGTDGDVCVVTVLPGTLPTQGCAAPTDRLRITVADADGNPALVLAAPGTSPGDGWHEVAPGVWVVD
ncbi:hypothetical protein [Cellulomonas composti]|uniref:Uncharacterized protein n=1 Tax=Cellulomonas composti TaxID=266130 RepID=A0A511JBB9_9CELL|nr:hypothetical protein [Cellulomonas composti]GEL95280.1 hypothetical protein CCO02nite_19380 [Cellulomonas composti]